MFPSKSANLPSQYLQICSTAKPIAKSINYKMLHKYVYLFWVGQELYNNPPHPVGKSSEQPSQDGAETPENLLGYTLSEY